MMSYRENLQKCHEYVRALEEERRKIQMFQRELPLCLEIVTQTIESCKKQLPGTTAAATTTTSTECSEQTSSEGVVFEEFIPIKSCPVRDVGEDIGEGDNKEVEYSQKSDWLRSAQLWSQSPDPPTNEVKEDDSSLQVSGVEVKSMEAVAPPAAATKEGLTRKSRRCWSPELHRRFLNALQQLGGPHVATPKQIREVMKVDGLTNDEVKSHLQKYRLHSSRRGSSSSGTSTEAAPQFVVVGGIWVRPATAQQQLQPRQETNNKGARCNSPAMSSSSSARAATAPPATCT